MHTLVSPDSRRQTLIPEPLVITRYAEESFKAGMREPRRWTRTLGENSCQIHPSPPDDYRFDSDYIHRNNSHGKAKDRTPRFGREREKKKQEQQNKGENQLGRTLPTISCPKHINNSPNPHHPRLLREEETKNSRTPKNLVAFVSRSRSFDQTNHCSRTWLHLYQPLRPPLLLLPLHPPIAPKWTKTSSKPHKLDFTSFC
jgi:hypothetical protein